MKSTSVYHKNSHKKGHGKNASHNIAGIQGTEGQDKLNVGDMALNVDEGDDARRPQHAHTSDSLL